MNLDQSLLFGVFFIGILIVPVAPIAIWYRNRVLRGVDSDVRERVLFTLHRDTRRMWVAWAMAVVGLFAWLGIEHVTDGTNRAILPVNMAVLIGFHVLFWPFVAPVLNRLERLVSEAQPNTDARNRIRTASLKRRRLGDYLPHYWKVLVAIVCLSGVLVAAASFLQYGHVETRFVVMAVGFSAFGLFELLLCGFVMRFEVEAAATYGGLTKAAAEELRQFRVRGFFWMLLAASAVFFICSLGCLEVGRGTIAEPNLGIVGGVAGTLMGFAGAGFGIAASLKMNRLRQESNAAN